jgi:hypothetical protein
MKTLTQGKVEGLRGELFHMILFAMAWVMIGEYSLDFKDYAVAAILVLLMVVWLAIHSIKLYELEDRLPEDNKTDQLSFSNVYEKTRGWLFALIFILEGVAILVTWMLLLKLQRDNWLIPCFALIAGLHFFPLARLIRRNSYYILGVWMCGVAIAGYVLSYHNIVTVDTANTLISYGCAAGAVADGIGVMARTWKSIRLPQG